MKTFHFIPALLALFLVACEQKAASVVTEQSAVEQEIEHRQLLDQTVWAPEAQAQEFEGLFVRLWDDIRASEDKFSPLEGVPFTSLSFGKALPPTTLDLGIVRTGFSDSPATHLNHEQFLLTITNLRAHGIEIVETEWHHSKFTPASGETPPKSVIGTVLHLLHKYPDSIEDRFILRTDLHVSWNPGASAPTLDSVEARNLRILRREKIKPEFVKQMTLSRGTHPLPTAQPLILNDLEGDGLSEVVIPSWNRIYRNKGRGKWARENLSEIMTPLQKAAIVADFNGDRLPDLFSISAQYRRPVLFTGIPGGRFNNAVPCGAFEFKSPSAITAGDIDADGDLDLWIAQHKVAYFEGQMPTPYYDANDGYPSALLINDGKGNFTEATEKAGLGNKRHRRSYSASFADLDNDHDLDLLVVSDFSGVDLYENDGKGHFTGRNDTWIGPRHTFGMGHVLDDFDKDGHQDLYAIGMSSTTARRLDQMNLSRDDHPDIAQMRAEMAYGNRMYLGASKPPFQNPSFAPKIARTGWSWGVTSFDYDNDGDRDIYVGNGHWSGKSCKDYCSTYWTQDIYTGSSKHDPTIRSVFARSMRDLHAGNMSWNGYENNVLLQNLGGKDFSNVSFLLGVSFSYDARSVVSDDLNADGRPDFLVAQAEYNSQRKFDTTFFGYINTLATGNNWIGIYLRNHGPGLSPIGAKVTVHSSAGIQRRQIVTGDSFRSQHANTLHFGLGPKGTVEQIEIRWPNGRLSKIHKPPVNRYHQVPAP